VFLAWCLKAYSCLPFAEGRAAKKVATNLADQRKQKPGYLQLLGEVRKKGNLNSRILEKPRAGDYRHSW